MNQIHTWCKAKGYSQEVVSQYDKVLQP